MSRYKQGKHEAIIWQRFFVLLVFVFLAPLCISPVNAVPLSDALQSSSQHGFSLAVRPRSDASRRDFVRDWAAAHRRWGHGGVPKEVATKFSLSDSREFIFSFFLVCLTCIGLGTHFSFLFLEEKKKRKADDVGCSWPR